MAEEEGEIITVQVPAEPTVQTGNADPVAELKAQYTELQEQQKRDLEARNAAEDRARTADANREQAEHVARTAQSEAADTRMVAIDQAIETAKAEADAATSEYSAALEAGDWKKAGEAQRKIARAEARGMQEETKKEAWTAAVEARKQQTQQPSDPVDAYIANISRETPNSANWLRNHRDWISDKDKNVRLTAAHWNAVAAGVRVDSPEYFDHVEKEIGLKAKTATNGSAGNPSQTPERKASGGGSAPVAPVSPSPGGTSGGMSEVRLTKGEAASATDGTIVWNYDDPSGQKRFKKGDPIGVQEMARRKKVMTEQGHYDKSRYEA